jgi:hypothetical protein
LLLSVPSATHDLAMANGFSPHSTPDRYTVCSMCDRPILPKEPCYIFVHDSSSVDLWCSPCVETKLPAQIASERALR